MKNIELEGNWVAGYAFDLHTLSRRYLVQNDYGHDSLNSTRTEIGELVYQLKYQQDLAVVNKIIDPLQKIEGFNKIDVLIPIRRVTRIEPFSLSIL